MTRPRKAKSRYAQAAAPSLRPRPAASKRVVARAAPMISEPVDLRFGALVSELTGVLGARLVAYLGCVAETRAVRQWIDMQRCPSELTKVRLFNALEIARLFVRRDAAEIAPTWFQGMNSGLDDRSPAEILRAATTRDTLATSSRAVKATAKAFLAD